jgi:hypothetical protein
MDDLTVICEEQRTHLRAVAHGMSRPRLVVSLCIRQGEHDHGAQSAGEHDQSMPRDASR